MRILSRRWFLASSGAALAAPALGAPRAAPVTDVPRSGWVDAVVVGAGAAGIAAGRRLAAAGKRFVVLEAADEVGGRCITDTKTFGIPYDRGARWIYAADINPLAKLGMQSGLDIYAAPPGQRMRIGRRYAREGEMEDFLASLVRANTAIADAARKSDVACAQALPKELGEWRPTIEFVLGPYGCSKELSDVSTNVLTSGKLRLEPELPKRHMEAATKLKLGSRDHVALELTGNPLGLRADELVFEKSESKQTAAILANVSGSTICVIEVGGNFGRDLAAKGEAAMIDFGINWLGGLYGTDVKSIVKRRHATRWNNEPWVLGATPAPAPGAQSAPRGLAEPPPDRIFSAGEATHKTPWGPRNGAWESGERAAGAVVKLLGGPSKRG